MVGGENGRRGGGAGSRLGTKHQMGGAHLSAGGRRTGGGYINRGGVRGQVNMAGAASVLRLGVIRGRAGVYMEARGAREAT